MSRCHGKHSETVDEQEYDVQDTQASEGHGRHRQKSTRRVHRVYITRCYSRNRRWTLASHSSEPLPCNSVHAAWQSEPRPGSSFIDETRIYFSTCLEDADKRSSTACKAGPANLRRSWEVTRIHIYVHDAVKRPNTVWHRCSLAIYKNLD